MMRMFCDTCGTEIDKSYIDEPLESKKSFRHDGKVVKLRVEVRASMDLPDGKPHHVCRDCVIDTVDEADTRPQSADNAAAQA